MDPSIHNFLYQVVKENGAISIKEAKLLCEVYVHGNFKGSSKLSTRFYSTASMIYTTISNELKRLRSGFKGQVVSLLLQDTFENPESKRDIQAKY